MRRKLYPLPVEALVDNPDLLAMPAAGAGIVLRLVLHFWSTECRPLPKADHELKAIARAHTPTWVTWKPHVLKVMAAIEPELVAYKRKRDAGETSLNFARIKAGATAKAKARAQASLQPPPSPMLPTVEANAAARPVSAVKRQAAKREAALTDARMMDVAA